MKEMDRNELHEEYKKTIKKMLNIYTSFLAYHMNENGDKNLIEVIDLFIETHIRKEPNPDWKPQ